MSEIGEETLVQAEAAFREGDFVRAAGLCRDILRAEPDRVPALRLLGVSRFQAGEREPGVEDLARAVALAPDNLSLLVDYAVALSGQGRRDEAIAVLRDAPSHPDLLLLLGRMLSDAARPGEAEAVLARAVGMAPDRVDIRCRLAEEYCANLRLDDALGHFSVAALQEPVNPVIQSNLGLVYQARADLDGAARHYRAAIELRTDNAIAHMNLATVLLTGFDFIAGFREAEWRLKLPGVDLDTLPAPRWQGEPLTGRRLRVYTEQGFGDMIQFARFLRPLAALGGEAQVDTPAELAALFATLPGVAAAGPSETLPPADLAVPMLSLPFILRSGLEDIARSVPYLAPPAGRRFDSPPGPGLRVGVVWASRPARGELYVRRALDRRRCSFEDFEPVLRVPGIAYIGLQMGEEAAWPAARGLAVQDLSGVLRDFADTAAVIASLDLVVGIDTAVLHLAGAMGKPAWVMLSPGQADYRWGVGAESSPWYPQMRLFRANAAGWPALVATVAAELEAVAAGKGRLYPPPAWGWSPPRGGRGRAP